MSPLKAQVGGAVWEETRGGTQGPQHRWQHSLGPEPHGVRLGSGGGKSKVGRQCAQRLVGALSWAAGSPTAGSGPGFSVRPGTGLLFRPFRVVLGDGRSAVQL